MRYMVFIIIVVVEVLGDFWRFCIMVMVIVMKSLRRLEYESGNCDRRY